jgi:hypothetical protein
MNIFRKEAETRAFLVWKIALTLIGDAVIFCLWLGVSYVITCLTTVAKKKGLHEPVAEYFILVGNYGTLALAAGYIVSDLVGVARDIRRRWLDGKL